MPKEYINNRFYGQTADQLHVDADGREVGRSRVAIDDSAVKVGWTKDLDHVELAVVHHRDSADGSDADAESWHAQMDRAGINRLIHTLRKARDAAFGADA